MRLGCRNEDLDRAVSYLRASADVRPDYRLSSFAPSLDLVREVCAGGRWENGLDYLHVWEETWDDPRLGQWIAARQRLPTSRTGRVRVAKRDVNGGSAAVHSRAKGADLSQPFVEAVQLALFWSTIFARLSLMPPASAPRFAATSSTAGSN